MLGFDIDETLDNFLDWLRETYSIVNPRTVESLHTMLIFLDEPIVQRWEDSTLVWIAATDNFLDTLLPIIFVRIVPNEDNGLYIFADCFDYHIALADELRQKFLLLVAQRYDVDLVVAGEKEEITYTSPPKTWKGERLGLIARKVGVSPKRLHKFIRIEDEFVPAGLTQKEMAEELEQSEETIKDDIAFMKSHIEYFPNTVERYAKTTPPQIPSKSPNKPPFLALESSIKIVDS